MEALVGLLLLLLFSFLAFRYGHNSLPGIDSPEERLASAGFRDDRETTTVGMDESEPLSLTARGPAGGPAPVTSQAA